MMDINGREYWPPAVSLSQADIPVAEAKGVPQRGHLAKESGQPGSVFPSPRKSQIANFRFQRRRSNGN